MSVSLPDRPTLTAPEVAVLLRVSRDAIYDAVARGDIPAIRIGRSIRIPTAKIADMLGLQIEPGHLSTPVGNGHPGSLPDLGE